jgi:hypothetical protein
MRLAALPDDPRLPALVAFQEESVEAVLLRHGVRTSGAAVRVLGHNRGERCTLLVQGDRGPLVDDAYAEDPAPLLSILDALAAAGLADGRAPSVPPLLAWDRPLRFAVTPLFGGPSMHRLIREGVPVRAGKLAAAWLRAASGAELAIGLSYSPDTLLAEAPAWLSTFQAADTALAAEAMRHVAVLAADPPASDRPMLVHGSYSPDHVLELPDGPGVIDLDNVGHGPLELDAGMMLASLSRLRSGSARRAAAMERAAQTFRSGVTGLVDESALEWYRAALLVKVAKRLTDKRMKRWLPRSRTLLEEAGQALAAR